MEWGPDDMIKGRIVPPEIQDDKFWKNNQDNKTIPLFHNFITKESLLLFGLLGREREDFQVFQQPCARWRESDMYNRFYVFINIAQEHSITGMTVLNDMAERKIALMKGRIGKVHDEQRL